MRTKCSRRRARWPRYAARTRISRRTSCSGAFTPAHHTTFQLIRTKAVFPLGWPLADRTRNLMDAQMGPDSEENGAKVRRIAQVVRQGAMRRDVVQELAAKAENKPTFQE